MVENVGGVHAELQRLGFRDLEALAEVRIEPESARHVECGLSEVALTSRLWVLEHDDAVSRIAIGVHSDLDGSGCPRRNELRDSGKGATQSRWIRRLARAGSRTLWVCDRYVRVVLSKEASSVAHAIPVKIGVPHVEISD